MPNHRVAIVAGARTPFVKAGLAFSSLGPLALAKHAVRGLLDCHNVDPSGIEAIAFGAVVPERGKPTEFRQVRGPSSQMQCNMPALQQARHALAAE